LRRLSTADRATLALLGFYLVAAFTIELWFVVHFHDVTRQTGLFARAYEMYGAADAAYYGRGDVFVPLALESFNVFFTQALNVLLAFAIVRYRSWRHPLQLLVSSYVVYSVLIYFWIAGVSGFAGMPERSPAAFALLFAANAPWLLGYGWMAWRSFGVLTRKMAKAPAGPRRW
jgi:hypothetical protein